MMDQVAVCPDAANLYVENGNVRLPDFREDNLFKAIKCKTETAEELEEAIEEVGSRTLGFKGGFSY